jgi:hypothetical protein
LANLKAYAVRYVPVAQRAGVRFSARQMAGLEVIERLVGNATTEFGAPAVPAAYERQALDANGAKRLRALLAASWHLLDSVTTLAPAQLRKGPRGGGRDRDAIAQHVAQAEISYGRKLGIRHGDDLAAIRTALLGILGSSSDGQPVGEKGWLPRYGARRIAWHVLDHAWEIEDRS